MTNRVHRLLWVCPLWGMEVHLWLAWRLTQGLRNRSLNAAVLAGSLILVAFLTLAFVLFPARTDRVLRWGLRLKKRLGRLRWLLLAVEVVIFPALILFSPVAGKFVPWSARWLGFFLISLGAAFFLAPYEALRIRFQDLLRGFLLTGATFTFLSAFVDVSSYPFPLSWSEGNRLWDYSLMFAKHRYFYPADQPIFAHIDLGRQFLWGLVYLIPGVSIFGVRLWSAFLFTVPYLVFAWVAFARPKTPWALMFWVGLWGFLFLEQGPIYTPLLLSALLLVVAESWAPWWLGGGLAVGAGFYAAMTRYTWLWAPMLWGLMLTMGTDKVGEEQNSASKARKIVALSGGGLLGAFLSGEMNKFWNAALGLMQKYLKMDFGLSSTAVIFPAKQPLVWTRLWPNPTFPLGIVFGVIVAIAPLVALWVLWYQQGFWRCQRWRCGLFSVILVYFLAVGLIASLKIGGGNNLHNLDMFLISMLMLTALFWRQGSWQWLQRRSWSTVEQGVALALVTVPLYFAFLYASPRRIPEEHYWRPALEAVQQAVHDAHAQGGSVLFLDHRQLLTFGFVEPVPLIPEYEKKYMMDQAMAGNREYFEQYYRDLASHRFALIVSEPLVVRWEEEREHNFASENNAWVKWVAAPTLCYYEPKATFKAVGLQLLVPREGHVDCRDVLP